MRTVFVLGLLAVLGVAASAAPAPAAAPVKVLARRALKIAVVHAAPVQVTPVKAPENGALTVAPVKRYKKEGYGGARRRLRMDYFEKYEHAPKEDAPKEDDEEEDETEEELVAPPGDILEKERIIERLLGHPLG